MKKIFISFIASVLFLYSIVIYPNCSLKASAVDDTVITSSTSSTPVSTGTITASALNIRTGASTNYHILGVYRRGTSVDIYGETSGWYRVKYNNDFAYICGEYVRLGGTSASQSTTTTVSNKGIVTASALNIRTGAGTNYAKVGLLYRGTTVPITGKTGNWYSILHNGSTRYVCADYINASPTQSTTSTSTTNTTSSGNMTNIGRFKITGYDACKSCCGKTDGITASGTKATAGRTIAMKGYPFGTKIYIEGLGTYIVEDRGVGSGVIDVFCNNHSECYAITGYYNAYVVN